jgi:potassium/chloride transporter 4/5/6
LVQRRAVLGTVMGVFVPCLQNIMGIVLFIRLSW